LAINLTKDQTLRWKGKHRIQDTPEKRKQVNNF